MDLVDLDQTQKFDTVRCTHYQKRTPDSIVQPLVELILSAGKVLPKPLHRDPGLTKIP